MQRKTKRKNSEAHQALIDRLRGIIREEQSKPRKRAEQMKSYKAGQIDGTYFVSPRKSIWW